MIRQFVVLISTLVSLTNYVNSIQTKYELINFIDQIFDIIYRKTIICYRLISKTR